MEFFVPFVVAVAVIVSLVALFVGMYNEGHKNDKQTLESLEREPETVSYQAKAVAKRAEMVRWGTKIPGHKLLFYVTFFTSDGERIELDVPQEIWEPITKDQTGRLVILNGKFYGFGNGEEKT